MTECRQFIHIKPNDSRVIKSKHQIIKMKSIIVILSCLPLVLASNGPPAGPRICVRYSDSGLKFPIHVYLNGTVSDVKQTIFEMSFHTIWPKGQLLRFNGHFLEDKQTLEHYNIRYHSDIELNYRPTIDDRQYTQRRVGISSSKGGRYAATVNVRVLGTSTFSIDVDLTDSIGLVKRRINKQEEYPVDKQNLYFEAFSILPLSDRETLKSVGVVDGSQLLLRVPLTWCYNEDRQGFFSPPDSPKF